MVTATQDVSGKAAAGAAQEANGFKLFEYKPIVNATLRDGRITPTEGKEYEQQLKMLRDNAAALWNAKVAKYENYVPGALAHKHENVSGKYKKLTDWLLSIEKELADFRDSTLKFSLLGMARIEKNLFTELGLRLVFTSKEDIGAMVRNAETDEERLKWIGIMLAHDRASIIAIEQTLKLAGGNLLMNPKDITGDSIEYESRRRAYELTLKTVELDFACVRGILRKMKREQAHAVEATVGRTREVLEVSKKRMAELTESVLKVPGTENFIKTNTSHKGLVRGIATGLLAFGVVQTLLDTANVTKLDFLSYIGGASLVLGIAAVIADVISDATGARDAIKEREEKKEVEAKVKPVFDQIKESTFVTRSH